MVVVDMKNYTPQYYWDELCDNNAIQFLSWYIATNDLAILLAFLTNCLLNVSPTLYDHCSKYKSCLKTERVPH